MKITVTLKESLFDCYAQITDSRGVREHYIPLCGEGETYSAVTAEVFDSDFLLTLIPVTADINGMVDEVQGNGLFGVLLTYPIQVGRIKYLTRKYEKPLPNSIISAKKSGNGIMKK